jgi:hypothetical protein
MTIRSEMRTKMLLPLLSIVLILIAMIYLVVSRQLVDILDVIRSMDIYYFILSIVFIFISTIILALRWSIITTEIGANESRKLTMLIGAHSLGILLSLIMPMKSGYYIKVPILRSIDGIKYKQAIAAVNIETLSDLIYLLSLVPVYILIMMLPLHQDSIISIFIYIMLIFVFLLLLSTILIQICLKLTPTISNLKLSYLGFAWHMVMKLVELVTMTKELITKKGLLNKSLIITSLSQLVGVFGVYLLVFSIGESMSFVSFFYYFTISYMIGILSMLPGGIGTTDVSLVVLLQSGGMALPNAVAIAILSRVIIYSVSAFLTIFLILKYHDLIKKLRNYAANDPNMT